MEIVPKHTDKMVGCGRAIIDAHLAVSSCILQHLTQARRGPSGTLVIEGACKLWKSLHLDDDGSENPELAGDV
jgi:hypothetical protein